MKRHVFVADGRSELQYSGTINNNTGKNMYRKNAVVKYCFVPPMLIGARSKVLVFWNELV